MTVIRSSDKIKFDATSTVEVQDTSLRLANLTTAQRNALTASNGDMIYNSTINQFEVYENGTWRSLASDQNVTDEVAALVDSAPSTLDTLNELAAALGDDPNFATTTTNNLAGKLNLSGGTMTGTLTLSGAPSSNLHAATKAYVDTAVASAGGGSLELQYGQYGASNATLNPGDTAIIKLLGDLSGNSVGVSLSRNNDGNDRLINSNFAPSAIATYTNNTGSAITGVNASLLSNPVNFMWFIDRA